MHARVCCSQEAKKPSAVRPPLEHKRLLSNFLFQKKIKRPNNRGELVLFVPLVCHCYWNLRRDSVLHRKHFSERSVLGFFLHLTIVEGILMWVITLTLTIMKWSDHWNRASWLIPTAFISLDVPDPQLCFVGWILVQTGNLSPVLEDMHMFFLLFLKEMKGRLFFTIRTPTLHVHFLYDWTKTKTRFYGFCLIFTSILQCKW